MLAENGQTNRTYIPHIDSLLVAKTPASFLHLTISYKKHAEEDRKRSIFVTYDARKSTPTGFGSCTKLRVCKSVAKIVFYAKQNKEKL